jgi:hypothetical protein
MAELEASRFVVGCQQMHLSEQQLVLILQVRKISVPLIDQDRRQSPASVFQRVDDSRVEPAWVSGGLEGFRLGMRKALVSLISRWI